MTHIPVDDKQLIALALQAQTGDKLAYSKLLESVTPIIKGFIYNHIGYGLDHEDIMQEVLLGIHRSFHTYNSQRSFKNWAFAIANHKVKDYLRAYYRKKEFKEVDFESIENFITDPVTEQATPGEQLNEVLAVLPEKQRHIVQLMKIEGFTAKQVAKKMNMSISAVKVSAHRAYKELIAKAEKGEL